VRSAVLATAQASGNTACGNLFVILLQKLNAT